MMKAKNIVVWFAALVLGAVSLGCGGGGGGGESSSALPKTGLRVLHGAIAAAPVELWSADANPQVVASGTFALAADYAGLAKGAHLFTLREANNAAGPSIPYELTIVDQQRQTLLVYGGNGFPNTKQSVLEGYTGNLDPSQAAVRVVDALEGVAGLDALMAGNNLEASYGSASAYTIVSAGTVDLVVAEDGTGATIASRSFTVEGGKAYSVLVTGEWGYLVLATLYQD